MGTRNGVLGDEARGNRAGYWRGHIRACESSGLSIVGYCRREGLSASGYHWWKRRLKVHKESGVSGTMSVAAAFAEVAVVPPEADVRAALEVVVRGGRVIRIGPGFDAETLARVLDVLEVRGC